MAWSTGLPMGVSMQISGPGSIFRSFVGPRRYGDARARSMDRRPGPRHRAGRRVPGRRAQAGATGAWSGDGVPPTRRRSGAAPGPARRRTRRRRPRRARVQVLLPEPEVPLQARARAAAAAGRPGGPRAGHPGRRRGSVARRPGDRARRRPPRAAARATPRRPHAAARHGRACRGRRRGARPVAARPGAHRAGRGDRGGYARIDAVAARMVDAQAPGLATSVRRLLGRPSGDDWRVAAARAVRAAAAAHRGAPPPRRPRARARGHGARSVVGYPVPTEQVLARPGLGTGVTSSAAGRAEERLPPAACTCAARPPAAGRSSCRSRPAASRWTGPWPRHVVDADLHFHPGAFPVRAAVGTRYGDPAPASRAGGVRLGDLASTGGGARRRPVAHRAARRPVGRASGPGGAVGAGRRHGAASCPSAGDRPWPLLALSGGRPVDVSAVATPAGLDLGGSARTTGG